MVIKGAIMVLIARYGIKIINGRPRTPRTQGPVEQTNRVLKKKLNKRIEATGKPNWSEHLVRIALAMNTQRHSSFPYNVTQYEVFLGRKYCNGANSLTTVEEAGPEPIRFTDEKINDAVDKNLPIIDEVMKKYVEHEACGEDEGENEEEGGEEDREEDGEEDGMENGEEDGGEYGLENWEKDGEEDREEDGEEDGEEDREEDREEDGEESEEQGEEKTSDEKEEEEDEEEDNITNMILGDKSNLQKFIILLDF